MKKSFYHYLLKYREYPPRDGIADFANQAFKDHSFPKDECNYDRLSRYLELNGSYLPSMSIFDEAWAKYEEEEG
ncbi:YozE family protein [Bacillus xiapuensis]|uniref:YozE family protein n=1 Tax=Bacillus xiapuensis TaxID=2014075 RepID=UPI000C23D3DB|nr:YozE family protein [Bacillus xiapuensis]